MRRRGEDEEEKRLINTLAVFVACMCGCLWLLQHLVKPEINSKHSDQTGNQ